MSLKFRVTGQVDQSLKGAAVLGVSESRELHWALPEPAAGLKTQEASETHTGPLGREMDACLLYKLSLRCPRWPQKTLFPVRVESYLYS